MSLSRQVACRGCAEASAHPADRSEETTGSPAAGSVRLSSGDTAPAHGSVRDDTASGSRRPGGVVNEWYGIRAPMSEFS